MGVPYHVPDAPLLPDMFRPVREEDGFVSPPAVKTLGGDDFVVREQREAVLARALTGADSYYVRALIDPEQPLSPAREVEFLRVAFLRSGYAAEDAARVVRSNTDTVMLVFLGRRARAMKNATAGIGSYEDLAHVAFGEDGDLGTLGWRSDRARLAYEAGMAEQTDCPLSYLFMMRAANRRRH
jgi:hypothetical protein